MSLNGTSWDRELALDLVHVTEAAALAVRHLIGRGQSKEADQAAVDAMRSALNHLPMKGRVVIGEGERDEAPMLYIGEEVGTGEGPEIDIALDPLEGTNLTAKAGPGALAVVAFAERGSLLYAPEGVLAAAALACVGGQIQTRLVFRNDDERNRAQRVGINDLDRKYTLEDMARGSVLFSATGVTTGALVQGVGRSPERRLMTETLLLCSRTGAAHTIRTRHAADEYPA